MKPLVSIIVATWNRGYFLRESLSAIKKQTYINWECLIIDDGSTDDTPIIVNEFSNKDPRFIYRKRSNSYKKGLPGCRNFGLDKAKGNYIVFFDDDDIPHPKLLELAIAELNLNNYDFCHYERGTFRGEFDDNFEVISNLRTEIISLVDLPAIIKNQLPFNSCQIVWTRSSIGKERFKESLMYAEEWEFYTRLLIKDLKGISIKRTLYFGRKHLKSNTGEFQKGDKVRLNSKIKATLLIIQNLSLNNFLSPDLKKYFIRLGFQLNSRGIINHTLQKANSGLFEKLKYRIGFMIYPVLRPLFILKGRLFSR